MRNRRSLVGLVVALVTAALVWWSQGDGTTPDAGPDGTPSAQAPSPSDGGSDPGSGLPVVAAADLPPEAHDTLALIEQGGPYPEDEDGSTFQNREGILPDRETGYYREFTVPTPGSDDRGARRIVAGSGGELYWTDDHYASFSRIEREGAR